MNELPLGRRKKNQSTSLPWQFDVTRHLWHVFCDICATLASSDGDKPTLINFLGATGKNAGSGWCGEILQIYRYNRN
ncbi:hypothetical protein GGR90_001870 [Sphingopyxis italica]|uniref:Uncharacterized protein n=1 Tax=Sphingopyxis italica TaxID=1129133 RepID=A0A7X5XR08_9SPHN|nr:hypothetical protein [Sphingopyxis italica]NJB89695.1 hypothetical protein [Sphingopyxis italica]